ncbi:MAG: LacI family transcriptional regulator [Lachnoclostridium sp.]|nr:LacI family transcriptional regulator [Lachnoclostridium sp.]
MATLDDIARELGVSKGTVSKALNGAKDVSQKTKQHVLETAVRLGYFRAPRNAPSQKVALFVINMEYTKPEDFGYDVVTGFRIVAEPAGFLVDVIPLTRQMQLDCHYDDYMIQHGYCGGFLLGLSLSEPWLQDFATCKTPSILYDNYIRGNPRVTSIGIDNEEGIEMAVNYLQSLGHQRIGYLSSDLDSHVYRKRYDAFSRIMLKNGYIADESVMGADFHVNICLSNHLPRLLKNNCTAILCSHDILAHSVMVYCLELGMRIPDDISIMGFDDIPLCRYTAPPLTTICQKRIDLGKSAFNALKSQLNHVPIGTLLLHAELVERTSCGPLTTKRAENE